MRVIEVGLSETDAVVVGSNVSAKAEVVAFGRFGSTHESNRRM